MKWKKLKHHQYEMLRYFVQIWVVCLLFCSILYFVLNKSWCLIGMAVMFFIGVTYIATIHVKICKIRTISNLMEDFIRKNNLYQSHYIIKSGFLRDREVEMMDYYPQLFYTEVRSNNTFYIRFRLDGSAISQKFKHLGEPLEEMFSAECSDIIYERGYITYCFELCEQEQVKIKSKKDILSGGENEIVFSKSIVWNWKKTPHLLLTGNTGSGKTQLAQYIISCLLAQGVRVFYCDPKNDDNMRFFLESVPSVVYVTQENEIANVVREVEAEVRHREQDLKDIGIQEAEFNPIFLMFDELIAFSKIAEKRTYEETAKRLSAIIVSGRSKRVYAGCILQRGDTSFIEGAIRDNLGCRICMGQMSEAAYKMAFGSEFSHVKNYRHEVGSGLIFRQGVDTKPREFLAPFICEGALSRV